MLINQFNGGLNTRLAPHLIPPMSAVVYSNIDNDRGELAPVRMPSNLYIHSETYFYRFEDTWISSEIERSYVEFQGVLYWSEDGDTAKKHSDGETTELGIAEPTGTPTVALHPDGNGELVGTYTYYVTYYNSRYGIESKPLMVTPAEIVVQNRKASLSSLPVSTDPQVDTLRIYRLGGNLTLRTLVDDVTNGTTEYIDNIADIYVDGYIMESETYDKAPDGLMHLTEHNSGLVGAVGSRIYFTPVANTNAWPALDYLDVPNTITGIGSSSIGLLVFTEASTYVISGTEFLSSSKYLLDSSHGCVSHHTIAKLGGSLLWVSGSGICNIKDGAVSVLSRPVLGKIGVSVNAVVHNDIYYLQLEDKILALDTRFNLIFKEFSYQFSWLGMFDNTLYGVERNSIHTLFSSDLIDDLDWLSPEYSEGSMSHAKTYYGVYFNSFGRLTVEMFIDGRSAQFRPLGIVGITEILVPQDLQNGYSIQFRIKGKGTLKEIEWKVKGRENGR